jgi:hypothetical protein
MSVNVLNKNENINYQSKEFKNSLLSVEEKKVKIRYDRALLDEVLERDGAKLVVEDSEAYEKLTMYTKIKFICICGKEGEKGLRCLYQKRGAYCNYCITNNKNNYPEELICKKYEIEPILENIKKLKKCLQAKVYAFQNRDLKKINKCVTIENAKLLKDHKFNIHELSGYFTEELEKFKYLNGKKISEITEEQLLEISQYIYNNNLPVLISKNNYNDCKLLVNKIPNYEQILYEDLCDLLINNDNLCSYCKCKMVLFSDSYLESKMTIDSIIPLKGHIKNNLTICCSLCNSKKGYKNNLENL